MGGSGAKSKQSGFIGGGTGVGGTGKGTGIGGTGSVGGGRLGGGSDKTGGTGGGGVGGGGTSTVGTGNTQNQGATGTGVGGSIGWSSTLNIDGVEIKQYTEIHLFNNGTSVGGIEAKALVYQLPDGRKIFYQENYDRDKQQTTIEEVFRAYNAMPEWIRARVPGTIEMVDYENPNDAHWRQVYKNFSKSNATGGANRITFYGVGHKRSAYGLLNTLSHETGHAIDFSYSQRLSDTPDWVTAMRRDLMHSGRKSPTSYGENAKAEDFAESMAAYVTRNVWFKENFPNRYDIIDMIKQYS